MRIVPALVLLLAAATTAHAQTTLYQGPVEFERHGAWTQRSDVVPATFTDMLDSETLSKIGKTQFSESMVIAVTGPAGVRINQARLNSGTKTIEVLIQEAPRSDERTHAHVIRITRTVFLSSLTARWGRKDGFEGWSVKFEREALQAVNLNGVLRHAATELETMSATYDLGGVRRLWEALPHDAFAMRQRLLSPQDRVLAEVTGLLSPSRGEIVGITRVEIPGYVLQRTELSGVPNEDGHVAPFSEIYAFVPLNAPGNAGKRVTYQGWYSTDLAGNALERFYVEDVLELEGHNGSPRRITPYEINHQGFPARGTLPTFGGERPAEGPSAPARAEVAAAATVARRGMLDVVETGAGSEWEHDHPNCPGVSERYGCAIGTSVGTNLPVFMTWTEGDDGKADVSHKVPCADGGYRDFDRAVDRAIQLPGEVFTPNR